MAYPAPHQETLPQFRKGTQGVGTGGTSRPDLLEGAFGFLQQKQNAFERHAPTGGRLETIKEFFNAIKGQLSERLANPFTGAFCIAWVVWNFRLLMVFVGKGTYQEKFLYIDTSLYPDWKFWAVRGVAIPMATAVVYLWAYPRATHWLAEDYRKQQTRANNLMKAAEGTALLSIEESRALRLRFAEAEQQWNSQRDQLTKELDEQKGVVADLLRRREELLQQRTRLQEAVDSSNLAGGIGVHRGTVVKAKAPDPVLQPVSEKGRYTLSPANSTSLPKNLVAEQYTRQQLQVLSILREGNRLPTGDLVTRMQSKRFDVQRTLDRLLALELIDTPDDDEWYITEEGRAVLGAFVDANLWNFADEGF